MKHIFKQPLSTAGFSLIEILVGILLFSIIGIIASNSLFSLLRGAANIEISQEIKQGGEYAVSVLEQRIRNAKQVSMACDADGETSSSITIINQDSTNSQTTFDCFNFGTVATPHQRLREIGVSTNYITNTSVQVIDPTTQALSCTALFTCTAQDGITPSSLVIDFGLKQFPTVPNSPFQRFTSRISLRNK